MSNILSLQELLDEAGVASKFSRSSTKDMDRFWRVISQMDHNSVAEQESIFDKLKGEEWRQSCEDVCNDKIVTMYSNYLHKYYLEYKESFNITDSQLKEMAKDLAKKSWEDIIEYY